MTHPLFLVGNCSVFGVSHVGGDMTGFEEEVSLSTLIAKPKKMPMWVWCGGGGILIQCWCGMLCTDFIFFNK